MPFVGTLGGYRLNTGIAYLDRVFERLKAILHIVELILGW